MQAAITEHFRMQLTRATRSIRRYATVNSASSQHYAPVLCLLLLLFCGRVIGQALVAFFHVPFLPPMEEWFSGFLPYPQLLSCQIAVIAVLAKACSDCATNRGFFARPNRALGVFLQRFGSFYLLVMVCRYSFRMALWPAERWTGGCIPIFFHWVLASFVLVLAAYHLKSTNIHNDSPIKPSKRMRLIRLCAMIANLGWSTYQFAPSAMAYSAGLPSSTYAVRIDIQTQMTMPDGCHLIADVYKPMHQSKTDYLFLRLPKQRNALDSFCVPIRANVIARLWAERGYTVILQDQRGRDVFEPLTRLQTRTNS